MASVAARCLGRSLSGLGFSVIEVAPGAGVDLPDVDRGRRCLRDPQPADEQLDRARLGWGISIGIGGLLGGCLGASLQPRLPEPLLRRGLGLLALGLGIRYVVLATG